MKKLIAAGAALALTIASLGFGTAANASSGCVLDASNSRIVCYSDDTGRGTTGVTGTSGMATNPSTGVTYGYSIDRPVR